MSSHDIEQLIRNAQSARGTARGGQNSRVLNARPKTVADRYMDSASPKSSFDPMEAYNLKKLKRSLKGKLLYLTTIELLLGTYKNRNIILWLYEYKQQKRTLMLLHYECTVLTNRN